MTTIVAGRFDTDAQAQDAVQELTVRGFRRDDASKFFVNLRRVGSFDGPSLCTIKDFEQVSARVWAAEAVIESGGIDTLLKVNDDLTDDKTTHPCAVQVRSELGEGEEKEVTGKSDTLAVTLKNDYTRDSEGDEVDEGGTQLTDPQGNVLTDPQGNVLTP